MKAYKNIFEQIISPENLFSAWDAFKRGKRSREDVLRFERDLERNILQLHREFRDKSYQHGPYADFYICDPKRRHIHKATVRDRVVHHAVYAALNPVFEETFIADSYSCRIGKGTHRGVERLRIMLRKASRNGHQPCFVLKCDIKQFFASVDHGVLLSIIERRVKDPDALWLIQEIIGSFSLGLPIGNLTSQLFANVYLNGLDQFVKHELYIPHYARYTDDFVIVHTSPEQLAAWLEVIREFLHNRLKLELHPEKVIIRKYRRGIDFLGYVELPSHRLLRTRTKRRIITKISRGASYQSLQSCLGMLSHADCFRLSRELKNIWWLSQSEIEKPRDHGVEQ